MRIELIFTTVIILCTGVLSINSLAQSTVPQGLERKALNYFCDNISNIKKGLSDNKIRFSGYTIGKVSNIYELADCIGDIELIKDSIPNVEVLDSLIELNERYQYEKIKIISSCPILNKHIYSPFNKNIYTLHLFHALEYNGYYYVQVFLINRNRQTWTLGVRFDKSSLDVVDHCLSSLIY
jgi:hypothetical protein